jgi:membrane protein YqaA with SNARE-associated domain
MMIARPQRAYRYALLCTLGSVLGGLVGYALLGALLFETVGRPLIDLYGLGASFEVFRARFAAWGSWIIIAKGLTPIPFKLVTVNRLAGEIVVEHFREQHQSVSLSRRPLNDRALVLRRRLGFAESREFACNAICSF